MSNHTIKSKHTVQELFVVKIMNLRNEWGSISAIKSKKTRQDH